MAPTPFPTGNTASSGNNQDFVLIVILLGLMLFFLIRSIGKFSSSGLKVEGAQPCNASQHTSASELDPILSTPHLLHSSYVYRASYGKWSDHAHVPTSP